MPELTKADFTRARKNPYASRIAKQGYTVQVVPSTGRPKKDEQPRPTTTCAVRLTEQERKILAKKAAKAKLSLHAYMRKVLLAA